MSGASVAGLSTAFWLARIGWSVDVVERSETFRTGGQNVDVRGAAHEVITRMGLLPAVARANTTEAGTSFIGGKGQVLGGVPVEQEQDGPTAELEILRGDLAQIILDALPAEVAIRYGDRIGAVIDRPDRVDVTFESGAQGTYDLVVLAEGVRSSTRRMIFSGSVRKRQLGLNMAYGTIPRTAGDDDWWRWYAAPRQRGITLRPDNLGTIRATLAYVDQEESLSDLPIEDAKSRLAHVFEDAGWQSGRIIEGFLASNDVYVDYLTQIDMRTYSKGHVVATGDAAWCVTPLGGGGASLALIGSYVLAAYLSQAQDNDLGVALARYEEWMRPLIRDGQKLPAGTPDLFYPKTLLGIGLLRTLQRLLTTPPLRKVAARASHVAGTDQPLPELQADTD